MTVLRSGTYVPKNTKTVTVWPAPDKNGDGPELYRDHIDPNSGEYLGRNLVTDEQGNPVREYLPPKGFTEFRIAEPGADGQGSSYCRTDQRGRPLRNHLGHAVNIMPGSALVEHADGTYELLRDDLSQVRFAAAHDMHSDDSESHGDAPEDRYQSEPVSDRTPTLHDVMAGLDKLANVIVGALESKHSVPAHEPAKPESRSTEDEPRADEGWLVR